MVFYCDPKSTAMKKIIVRDDAEKSLVISLQMRL